MHRMVASVLLLGAVLAGQSESGAAALERRLKKQVDEALTRFARDLRLELHRAIEAAVRTGGAGDAMGEVRQASVLQLDDRSLARVHRIRLRLDALRRTAGSDSPEIERLSSDLRDQVGVLADLPVVPWGRLGIDVVPASMAFGVLWGASGPMGFVVVGADDSSSFRAGDVLVGYQGASLGVGTTGGVLLARDLSRETSFPLDIEVVRGATRSRESCRALVTGRPSTPPDDSKAMMDEMLRRAIRRVVPSGGVIQPSGVELKKKSTPERRRP